MNDENKAMSRPGAAAEVVLPGRRTPVYRSVDVLVCGGGLAGAAAAVAAARGGARTLLVERNVVLGGNGPLSFLTGLPALPSGIAGEIAERLRATGDLARDETDPDGPPVYDPEALKYVLLDLVREAGAGLLLSSWASDPILRDGAVAGAMVENKSGRFAIPARIVIDATGDGDIAARVRGRRANTGAYEVRLVMNARIGGIDFDRALAGSEAWPELVARAKLAGRLAAAQPDTIRLYGVTEAGRQRGIAYLRGPEIANRSPSNAEDLTAAEIEARELVREFIPFLRTVPGFEASFLVDVAGAIGVVPPQNIPSAGAGAGMAAPQSDLDKLMLISWAALPQFGAGIDIAALGELAGQTAAAAISGDPARVEAVSVQPMAHN